VYYGAEQGPNSGLGKLYPNPPPSFQITVYEPDFAVPDWAKNAIMYQIFPDRFASGDPESMKKGLAWHQEKGRSDIALHENWDELPQYEASHGQEFYMPCDMFGGDLEGVRQRLPYLKELGVSVIYLNPVFESASNHRYNTGDYLKIDPILGGEDAFERLIADAESAGMKVILDGVFAHTGEDSVYFNRFGRYDSSGAFQSTESPYFGWYVFSNWPESYNSWWGFGSLPAINKENPDWSNFVIEGEDSVVKTWVGKGASGYRLDVADELPDHVIEKIREHMKAENPEAFLIGEVWEDATTKESYGKLRSYALGKGLDSVMNYPFRDMTIAYILGRVDAVQYKRFLVNQQLNYPKEMYYALMNLLSSHDVARIRSVLSTGGEGKGMSREEQAKEEISAEDYESGAARQRLAAMIQFSIPGIPTVYYGDEVGMTGLLDPFNRKTYKVCDEEMLSFYKALGDIRKSRSALAVGGVRFYATIGGVLGIMRCTACGEDVLGRDAERSIVLTVVNPSAESKRIVVDLRHSDDCKADEAEEIFHGDEWTQAVSAFTGKRLEAEAGLFEIEMGPLEGDIFDIEWKANVEDSTKL
jgi:glycosidase